MERLTVIKSRKLAGPASLANILKTVDNIFANRCSRQWSCDFPPRKTLVAQKHQMISRQEKMAFSTPVGLSWDSPPPPTESVRTDGCADVRTDGHVTITSQPKFLGFIGYQISLAMELRWRALPAGSAMKKVYFDH